MKSWIKLFSIYILRFVNILFRVFPIKRGRIIFFSKNGGKTSYSCNPMYISEYIERNYPNQFEIIWAFSDIKKYRFLKMRGIKVIKLASLKRMYYETTAQVSINNIGSFSWLPLRKGQLHLNTWHGGGCYKRVSLGEKRNDPIKRKTLLLTAQETSYMLSTSEYFTNTVIPNDFGYNGEVLNYGFPRNDILINGNQKKIREKVCKYFNIPDNVDIILYAPTWRYEQDKEIVFPTFEEIMQAYKKKFKKNAVLLFRAHNRMQFDLSLKGYYNASDYPDMQELLMASDMLISDYSSCIWDYSLMYKPCLLFTPDLEQYITERGFNIDIYEWGFPVCTDNKQLYDGIIEFDQNKFTLAMKKHQSDLGCYDDGRACEKISNLLYTHCFGIENG